MTLEELLDDVTIAATLDHPESVNLSVGIHHINTDLLREFVDAHPELVQSKQTNYNGARIVLLHPQPGRSHYVTLFSDALTPSEW